MSDLVTESYEINVRALRHTGPLSREIDEKLTRERAQDFVNILSRSAQHAKKPIEYKNDSFEEKTGFSITVTIQGNGWASKFKQVHEAFIRGCANAVPRSSGIDLVIGINKFSGT